MRKPASLVITALAILVVICVQPAFCVTDYLFFSVNGDTTAVTMTQGDTVAWGANCDEGGSLRWEIWYDIGSDGTIDSAEDLQLFTYIAFDGFVSNPDGPPDVNPVPDGWYITPPMILGLAPGQYIFKAVDQGDNSWVQKSLGCIEMASPPNIFSGRLLVPGHLAPDPSVLKNHWVQAQGYNDESQIWGAVTNDSGSFRINVGDIGTGLTFEILPPEIPGFDTPAAQVLVASGVTEGVYFVYGGPPIGKTDYMFFSINGDTTGAAMIQGDTVAWGANCAFGGSLRWEIWYDVNQNGVIENPGDVQVIAFVATDGDTIGEYGLPDINGIPDGWFITQPIVLGAAPGHYIFKAVNRDDPSEVQKPLVCSEMTFPPNTISGHLIVPGHTAPDPTTLGYRWVQTESEEAADQVWAAMSNDSGRFQINVGNVGTGYTVRVTPPDIPGFVLPASQIVLVAGHIENMDFDYMIPADSVWGFVVDENSTAITEPVRLWCWPWYGSGGKDTWTEIGRYAIYFGPQELGAWSIGSFEGLVPAYMTPARFDFDNSSEHGIRHDFVCPTADTVIFARVTENHQSPSHQYRIEIRQEPSGLETWAVSGTGPNNIAALHVSKLYSDGYGAYVSTADDNYPIPPGYVPDYNPGAIYHPGDTVTLNLQRGFMVRDTVKSDPADPPLNFDSAQITMYGSTSYQGEVDANGVFTFYVQAGWYTLSAYIPGHLTNPGTYNLGWVNHDTTGGLGFEANWAHCRVHGSVLNIPLPLAWPVSLFAYGDSTHVGYQAYPQIDSATGTYEMWLCDGNWTLEAPDVFPGLLPPAPVHLMIDNLPDSERTVDLEYTGSLDVDDSKEPGMPTVAAIGQNYPNPFNLETVIEYSVPTRTVATIEIFNLMGQRVRTLLNESKAAGSYRIKWNGSDDAGRVVSTGMYLYRFKAGDVVQTKKMLLVK
jgi:hypothetical protein